jgi:hypothetical protein
VRYTATVAKIHQWLTDFVRFSFTFSNTFSRQPARLLAPLSVVGEPRGRGCSFATDTALTKSK